MSNELVKYDSANVPGETAIKTGGIVTAAAVVAGVLPVITTWQVGVGVLAFGVVRFIWGLKP